ncbi:MAG: hypothetical protein J2P28_16800, partial [Actinobacteria bacterium]|nr:hypothetical protein [Actinomycetota bacterium]
AAASGGPLGDGRLAAVGPSPWQVAVVSALELGIAAAITAGVVNYVALRRAEKWSAPAARVQPAAEDSGHVIYLDPWAGDEPRGRPSPPGPATVPRQRDWAPDPPSRA